MAKSIDINLSIEIIKEAFNNLPCYEDTLSYGLSQSIQIPFINCEEVVNEKCDTLHIYQMTFVIDHRKRSWILKSISE